ncbi:alpha/beta fold hydrolase [Persicitalea jodogahamensis]|uniref:Alpha/beta hydrolase n=1 Tax=Persicitalea jodogahamensis TaxID=402147 RepID=A0A8J3G8C9_9BACT|nr:alpha/beta hydrolase [Persicitalea jodogahamensis]GHB64788.1 alpha/beta hydrolase [Persicitalea jodogahamensis]
MKLGHLFSFLICVIFLSHSIVRAQEPLSSNGKFIDVNGAKIYIEDYGKGEPLILLHGFGRTLEDWKPYIPEFAKSYHVIAWDMRGHGRSTNPDTSNVFLHATAAQDLSALIKKLSLKKVKAIGHSSGGIIILYAALKEQDMFEAIVPISAQIYFSVQVREFIKNNAKPEAYYVFNELEKQHGEIKGRLIANQFYHFQELYGDPSITIDQLTVIKARTLVIHGDNDFVPASQAYEMYKSIPNAHLWIVPNGWHTPHIGGANEADFTKKTLEFLKGDWDKAR